MLSVELGPWAVAVRPATGASAGAILAGELERSRLLVRRGGEPCHCERRCHRVALTVVRDVLLADGISSFEDGTAEARVAASLYPIIRDALLCAHPWSFATAKTRLAKLSAEPVADHLHAFQLPQNFLKALSAGSEVRARGLSYQIVNRQLHADAGEVVLSYLFRPSEGDFPAYFSVALVNRLAAEFCIPVTENTSRAERLSRLAEDEIKLARLIDSQQDTPPRVEDFTLIEARSS